MTGGRPLLALTQGDPAGVGPEVAWKALGRADIEARVVLVAERAALAEPARLESRPRLQWLGADVGRDALLAVPEDRTPAIDPLGEARSIAPGRSTAADARAAVACLDAAVALARAGAVDGLVTGPVSKESIARHVLPEFRGHTDYLAAACGRERYGRDYLMAFLAPGLRVALATAHLPLAEAVAAIDRRTIVEAVECLAAHAGGRIAVAGLNPHAGEGGLLGREEIDIIAPAVAELAAAGHDVAGPEAPDSLFRRALDGEFDWVLALYHDQGLVAVKTVAFGAAVNWTLGLPFVRTSVDHGTGFGIAGRGVADAGPTLAALAAAAELASGGLRDAPT